MENIKKERMLGIKSRIYKRINSLYKKNTDIYDEEQFGLELRKTVFKGLSGIDVSRVYNILCIQGKQNLTDSANKVRNSVVYKYYHVEYQTKCQSDSYTCMCILPSYDVIRKDMVNRFEKVCNLIDQRVCIYGDSKRIELSIERLCLFFIWFRQMPKRGSIEIKLRLIASMIEAWQILKEYKALREDYNITRCLVLCDFQPVDTIVVQYLNSLEIETVSLQHGVYSEGSVPQLINSVASKILVYGRQSYDLFLKCGISGNRLVICGVPQIIGLKPREKIDNKPFHKIGVVMSGNIDDIYDIKMMNILTIFSKDKDWELYLKIRVGLSKEAYIKYNDLGVKEIYSGEIDSIDFVDNMDLIICGVSTITIESIERKVPVFIYSDKGRVAFPELEEYRFSDLASLESLYEKYCNHFDEYEKKIRQLKEYYCKENVEYNYQSFFSRCQ